MHVLHIATRCTDHTDIGSLLPVDGHRHPVHLRSDGDPLRDRRKRFSVNLTHPFAQHVKWRLQYNHDRADYLSGGNANSAWLQLVYQAGEHDEQ